MLSVCLIPWASDKAGESHWYVQDVFVSLGVSGHVVRFIYSFANHGMANFSRP